MAKTMKDYLVIIHEEDKKMCEYKMKLDKIRNSLCVLTHEIRDVDYFADGATKEDMRVLGKLNFYLGYYKAQIEVMIEEQTKDEPENI